MKSVFRMVMLVVATALMIGCSNTKVVHDGKYSYEVVKGDPLNARIYTLDNGLKVYLSVYKDAPRIQTCIPVRVGSKNDPADNTGLAHYLEHLLFKGTDEFGTNNFEAEKPLLDEITQLYELHKQETDSLKRLEIYQKIDSVSYKASQYAIAAEYDKMMSVIGAKGTNAFTSNDFTCYVNDIPSNHIQQWLELESERFRDPIFRIFHTELEVVYEEKNRAMDNDSRKRFDAVQAGLFPTHPYGTQTTLGSIEHLKNPSIQNVYDYFYTYYVPNNMAVCLSGDFNPDSVIVMVDKTFGTLKSEEVPQWDAPVETEIHIPIEKEVVGPDMESVIIGFRFPGINTKEAELLLVTDYIMMNSVAGIIDLNLKQKQKVISPFSGTNILKDYSGHYFGGRPREGQTLEEVKDLLLAQIDSLKAGAFPDWLPGAVVKNLKLDELRSYQKNSQRADALMEAFVNAEDWADVVNKWEFRYSITKDDVIKFANKYYGDNYVVVYKRTGKDSNVVKIQKPPITPVELNRESQSNFYKGIVHMESPAIEPVFLDYKKEISFGQLNDQVPVWYKNNEENDLFTLNYLQDMGQNHNKALGFALEYLSYLGTSDYSAEEVKQELYKLGCSFNTRCTDDINRIYLTGLSESFEPGLVLFEKLLADAQPDSMALENLIQDILKRRTDAKLNKNTILRAGLYSYAMYGKESPFRNALSEAEMRNYSPEDLIQMIQDIANYPHRILYYGSMSQDELKIALGKYHRIPDTFKSIPVPQKFIQLPTTRNQVFVCDYDMKQVELMMLSKSVPYNRENIAIRTLFNEYYGGNMSSVVFQTLRESKALAYSVWGAYRSPIQPEEAHYIQTYIGTQADKIGEALGGMFDLLNNMPEAQNAFDDSKQAIIRRIQTERITKDNILRQYDDAVRFSNDDHDIRQDIYQQVPDLTIADLKDFFNGMIKDKHYTIFMVGDVDALDFNILKKYGQVKELSLEEVFGY